MGRTLPLILLLAGCTVSQSRHAVTTEPLDARQSGDVPGRVIEDFSDPDAPGRWKLYTVEGSVNPLAHDLDDGALRLTSDRSAGLLWRAVSYDAADEPFLAWRWKVSRTFDGSSPLSPEFDNFPARLLVGFDSGWDNAGPAAMSWRRKVERVTGVTPPARAICYTFGGSLGSNEAVDAAFGEGRIVVINLRNRGAGEWFHEVRDIAGDYRAIFRETAPPVMALGIASDSHRMDATVRAWFDDLTAYPPQAAARFQQQLHPPPRRRTPPLVWIIMLAATGTAAASAGTWLWLRHRDREPQT
jgi:hypothetical protein